jgi:hypothetical protein
MVGNEVMHIAVAPPANVDENLVKNVAAVIQKSPFDTRLLLAGEIPKIIASCDSLQMAEYIILNLRNLGLNAIGFRDSWLRSSPQIFKTRTMELGEDDVLFRGIAGREERVAENDVFLIIKGMTETPAEVEVTKPKTKFSLTGTLLMGGIPVWRRVDEKTTTRSIQAESFARLYGRKASGPIIELLQHRMDYSFLGENMAPSSSANFTTVIQRLQQIFPRAIFDHRLEKSSMQSLSSGQGLHGVEINCKLIYLFHNDQFSAFVIPGEG